MMRKLKIASVLVCAVAVFFAGRVSAGELAITLYVNNRRVTTDVPLVEQDGRVMVPIRSVAEALGGSVEWDGEKREVRIYGAQFGVALTPLHPSPKPGELTALEQLAIDSINAERVKAGLDRFAVDMRLVTLARIKAQDMVDNDYRAHKSPTLGWSYEMLAQAGLFGFSGENIAWFPTVEKAHAFLINSEPHKANILSTEFERVGVGVIQGGPFGLTICQLFIGANK